VLEGSVAICYRETPEWVLKALADPTVWVVEQTLYDVNWYQRHGFDFRAKVVDIRALAHAVNENTAFDIEALAYRYAGIVMDKRLTKGKRPKFRMDDGKLVAIRDAPWPQLSAYCRGDVDAERETFLKLLPQVPNLERVVAMTQILVEMEGSGFPVDLDQAAEVQRRYHEELLRLEMELRETGNLPLQFNLNSPDQLAQFFHLKSFDLPVDIRIGAEEPPGWVEDEAKKVWRYGHITVEGKGWPIRSWTDPTDPSKRKPKTDAKTLAIQHGSDPWIKTYLKAAKLRTADSWLTGLPKHVWNGRVYGRFNQAGTVTGRLSSSDPNLQNVPRRGEIGDEIRGLFVGNLVIADFSQLEPRIAAHLSQDPFLLEVYREGLDIYKALAANIWGHSADETPKQEREVCKLLVLSMFYGAQARKTAENLSVAGYPTTQSEAGRLLQAQQDTMPRFFEWREETISWAQGMGFVETIGGRQRHLSYGDLGAAWKRDRQAVNSAIQGSAADIVDGTMMVVAAEIPELKMLCQVHDELVCEYSPDSWDDSILSRLRAAGEVGHGYLLTVPLVFEPTMGRSWAEK
jgi:DNA polymerase I-like protein with 3'-5' exonuclease and polymerase domains